MLLRRFLSAVVIHCAHVRIFTMGFRCAHVDNSPNNNSFSFLFHDVDDTVSATFPLLVGTQNASFAIDFFHLHFLFFTSTIKCTYINFFCYLQTLNLVTFVSHSYINSRKLNLPYFYPYFTFFVFPNHQSLLFIYFLLFFSLLLLSLIHI